MIDFLKSFFAGEKEPLPKQRDVIVLDAYAMNEEEEEQPSAGCGSGGCGSCGCG
jgi:hypothetical protein